MIHYNIGYHTINWGSEPDIPVMLKEIRAAGYSGVELCQPAEVLGSVKQLKILLGEFDLSVAAVSGSAQLIGQTAKDDIKAMKKRVEYSAEVGAKIFVLVPALHTRKNIQLNEYQQLADNLEILNDYASKYGILLTVHNHMGYLIQTKEDITRLFEANSRVELAFDTAHCAVAGDDCIDVIRSFAKRVKYVHLKDFNGVLPAGDSWSSADFAELGQGTGDINFAAVLKELETINYNGWLVVELDSAAAKRLPVESAKISRDYLRQLGY